MIDDFAMWRRPLSATEAAALAAATSELQLAPVVSVTSVTLVRSGANREAGAMTVSSGGN